MAVEGAVRFCQNNFLGASYATLTFTSAASGAAGANSVLPERHKRWIPNGHFEVTSSNNTVYINDGSNKTVTLTVASYTSGSALASHIQTQLNVSSTLWTLPTPRRILNSRSGDLQGREVFGSPKRQTPRGTCWAIPKWQTQTQGRV